MPQATASLTEEWNGPDDGTAIEYLEGRGFVLTRDFHWVPTAGHVISDKDRRAVIFLIQEWDFGGIIEPQSPVP